MIVYAVLVLKIKIFDKLSVQTNVHCLELCMPCITNSLHLVYRSHKGVHHSVLLDYKSVYTVCKLLCSEIVHLLKFTKRTLQVSQNVNCFVDFRV